MKKSFILLGLLGASIVTWSHNLAPGSSGRQSTERNSEYTTLRKVKIYQRRSAVIDTISNGQYSTASISIFIGDITRAQVLTTVSYRANGDIYRTISLHQGEVIKFKFGNLRYKVKLVQLFNKPIGHDYAVFSIERGSL